MRLASCRVGFSGSSSSFLYLVVLLSANLSPLARFLFTLVFVAKAVERQDDVGTLALRTAARGSAEMRGIVEYVRELHCETMYGLRGAQIEVRIEGTNKGREERRSEDGLRKGKDQALTLRPCFSAFDGSSEPPVLRST